MSDGFAITSDEWSEVDRLVVTHVDGPQFTLVLEKNLDVIDTREPHMAFGEAFRVRVSPRVPGAPAPRVFTGPEAAAVSRDYFEVCQFELIALPLPVAA